MGEAPVESAETDIAVFDFSKPDAAESWQTINDGVMGGVSEGKVRITLDKNLAFYGNLSLANNGGFASTRTKPRKLDLTTTQALVLRVRGDGRTYYFNVHVPTQLVAFSYRAKFDTEAGKWKEVRIPLNHLRATAHGRDVSDARSLDKSSIESVGFLLADKKPGSFKLEVAWIWALP